MNSINRNYITYCRSPPTLVELAGDVVDNLPLPDCWNWDIDVVLKWLRFEIKLPEYSKCFADNFINGKRLLLLDASSCPKIGIRNFAHIKRVMDGIRKLFKTEREQYYRSISLPPRYPWTHYLLYKIPTGPNREATTPSQLFKMMKILDTKSSYSLKSCKMTQSSQTCAPFNRFGLVKRNKTSKNNKLTILTIN